MASLDHTQPQSMRSFWLIWSGQAFSLFGSSLVQFALIWYLTVESGASPAILAIASAVGILPTVLLGPFIGPLVDRWNRRRVMLVADSFTALVTLALIGLYAFGLIAFWHIYVAMFLRALGQTFHMPAFQASTSVMVPEEQLDRISGLNQMLQGLVGVLAPPLGAFLLSLLPVASILTIDVLTAALAVGPLLLVTIPQPQRSPDAEVRSSLDEMREGFRYIWDWRGLAIFIGVATLFNFFLVPVMSFLPILASAHFGGGALEFGWMQAAFGMGLIVGGLTLGIAGGVFKRRMLTIAIGAVFVCMMVFVLGFASADSLGVAIGALLGIGAGLSIINGTAFALLQSIIDHHMQGRVFAILFAGSSAMTPLGLLVAGPFADVFGVRAWIVLAGIGCALITATVWTSRSVWQLENRKAVLAAELAAES